MAVSVISPNFPSTSHSPPLHKPHRHHSHLLNLLTNLNSLSELKQIQAHTLRTTCPNFPDTLFLNSRIFHSSSLLDLDYTFRLFSQFRTPNSFIWNTLMRACANSEGKKDEVFGLYKRMLCDEGFVMPDNGAYVLLSRVYAVANRWNEVGLVRNWMTDKEVKKEPGCSSIEMYGISHEFFSGDTSHSRTKEIYELLDVIDKRLEAIGYVPDVSQAPMIDEQELVDGKRHSLRLHSERLAIAFGLLNLPPGVPIRVFKNLRVCNDCHNVTKLISKIYNVEIIVRDRARFHHFRDGSCSCMDYW
ncbi:hypothetical protein ACET3Z_033044 [Daucus carota]